jgi:4-methyl-5(b-hydroxyethyl)-thiazole monophosphate biosynthesis
LSLWISSLGFVSDFDIRISHYREVAMAKNVLVPIADGTEEIEAVCIIDTLRRAGVEVTVASVAGPQIIASRGTNIIADALISECVGKEYDCIALPGGTTGAEHLRDSAPLVTKLKEQRASGRLLAAICASPALVLQHHGLLKGFKATCFPSFRDKLDPAYASNDRVVVDGAIITSQGPGTALDFALKLVELLSGPDKAKEIAKAMLVSMT